MVRVIPNRRATSVALFWGSASAAIAIFRVAGVTLRGRPPTRPRARAAVKPACVRSRISSASNSANAAKIPKTKRPFGRRRVDVRPRPRQHFQADVALVEVIHQANQVLQVAA